MISLFTPLQYGSQINPFKMLSPIMPQLCLKSTSNFPLQSEQNPAGPYVEVSRMACLPSSPAILCVCTGLGSSLFLMYIRNLGLGFPYGICTTVLSARLLHSLFSVVCSNMGLERIPRNPVHNNTTLPFSYYLLLLTLQHFLSSAI